MYRASAVFDIEKVFGDGFVETVITDVISLAGGILLGILGSKRVLISVHR